MPGVVEAATGGLADGLAGPVDYAAGWAVAAWGLIAAVVIWHAGLLWWGRPRRRRPVPAAASEQDVAALRAEHLARFDAVAAAVAEGSLEPRAGYRARREIARSFGEQPPPVPATTLTLAALRALALPLVVAALEVIYPPEFAPADHRGGEAAFDEALALVREVVATPWT